MSKENHPKDWKKFRLADGTERILPDWADKPLSFQIEPAEALQTSANVKPKSWKKAIRGKRQKSR